MNDKNVKHQFVRFFGLLPIVLLLVMSLGGCVTNEAQDSLSYMEKLWDENYSNYQAILNLPFNRGVADGTLPASKFRGYIIQDYLYLLNYKSVFEILLSKAPDERARLFVTAETQGINEEIETVHMIYCRKYNITNEELANSEPNQTTMDYNSFLIRTATDEPFPVGLTAALPCNWIYYRVATDMKNSGYVKNNPYQEWIDAYGSIPWDESDTGEFVKLIEYYMANDGQLRAKMEQVFNAAFKYEYLFWDAAYN